MDPRFTASSLDSARGLLFIAHLGASEVIEVDVQRQHGGAHHSRTWRRVHVFVRRPELQHEVFATATVDNHKGILDEDTGAVCEPGADRPVPPDWLSYDPKHVARCGPPIRTGGSETDDHAGTPLCGAAWIFGGRLGNVVYDPPIDRMLVWLSGSWRYGGDRPHPAPCRVDADRFAGLSDHPHRPGTRPAVGASFVSC